MSHNERLRLGCRVASLVLLFVTSMPLVIAEEPPDKNPYRGGFAYLGTFSISSIDSKLSIFSQDLPLGKQIDLSRDLGVRDSLTVPRIGLDWRFNRRHMISLGWYDMDQTGTRELSRTIEIRDREFTVGTTVSSRFKTEIFKLQYNWMFHTDSKVSLGLGAGFFIGDVAVRISQISSTGPTPVGSVAVNQKLTAPLPVLGGRLEYRATPKLSLLATADWFVLNYADYRGVLSDVQVLAHHRTFYHVGFGGGINLQSTDTEYDDDEFVWDVEDSFIGVMAVVTFYF